MAAASAVAAPEAPTDPVSQYLAENGLLDTAAAAEPAAAPSMPPAPGANEDRSFARKVRDGASDMVLTAMNFLGVPYRRGGSSADAGFDCSGFTRHVFEMSLGLVLPRRADEQADAEGLIRIGRNELRPGDLVFFNTLRRTFSHVGIYVGDGKFIHSPRVGGEVRVDSLSLDYWHKRFTGARRVEPAVSAAAMAALPQAKPAVPLQTIH